MNMKLEKILLFKKVDDPLKGLWVGKDVEGWMYILRLPYDKDNIFFCKEELEIAAGASLVLDSEYKIKVLDDNRFVPGERIS